MCIGARRRLRVEVLAGFNGLAECGCAGIVRCLHTAKLNVKAGQTIKVRFSQELQPNFSSQPNWDSLVAHPIQNVMEMPSITVYIEAPVVTTVDGLTAEKHPSKLGA